MLYFIRYLINFLITSSLISINFITNILKKNKKIIINENILIFNNKYNTYFLNKYDLDSWPCRNYIFKNCKYIFLIHGRIIKDINPLYIRDYSDYYYNDIYKTRNDFLELEYLDIHFNKKQIPKIHRIMSYYIPYIKFNINIYYDKLKKILELKDQEYNSNNIYNKIENDYYNTIINFDDSVKDYYDKFVNIFNNPDKNIIKICAFGKSGSGKTFFFKNIIKLIKKYNKTIYNFRNLYDIMNNHNNINRFDSIFLNNSCFPISIFNCNIDNFDHKIFKIIKNFKNVGINKIIYLIESFKYDNYFDDFDIQFTGNYVTELNVL